MPWPRRCSRVLLDPFPWTQRRGNKNLACSVTQALFTGVDVSRHGRPSRVWDARLGHLGVAWSSLRSVIDR